MLPTPELPGPPPPPTMRWSASRKSAAKRGVSEGYFFAGDRGEHCGLCLEGCGGGREVGAEVRLTGGSRR